MEAAAVSFHFHWVTKLSVVCYGCYDIAGVRTWVACGWQPSDILCTRLDLAHIIRTTISCSNTEVVALMQSTWLDAGSLFDFPCYNKCRSTRLLTVSIGYCTAGAGVDKRARSTSLYHCRQCSILLKPRSDRRDYVVVCFMTEDCGRKLENRTSASWVWFKQHCSRTTGKCPE